LSYALAAMILAGASCRQPATMEHLRGRALGAGFVIKYFPGNTKVTQEEISSYLKDFFVDLQNKTSLYQERSELMDINGKDYAGQIRVSDTLGSLISYAQGLSLETGGYYDITSGAISKLWNTGGMKKVRPVIPGEPEIEATKKRMGYEKLRVGRDDKGYYIEKQIPRMIIDLASITAGYAADRIARYLLSQGIVNFMIDVGGEFRASGKNNSQDWLIGIENPFDAEHAIFKTLRLKNRSMATSGSYKNFIKKNDVRYSHIIDPHTGKPVEGSLVSVSVVQDECMKADGLATAIFAMGEKRGFEFARQKQIPVLMIVLNEKGNIEARTTSQMDPFLAE